MWADSQRRRHEAHWPEVERLFSSLPPSLFRHAKLLEYDLALRYSATGEFRHIFLGPDQFPILSLAGWLIDDLGARRPDGADIRRRLFLVSIMLAARVEAIEAVVDPSSFSDESEIGLVEAFSARIASELAHLVPAGPPGSPGSSFWEEYQALSAIALDRVVGMRERDTATLTDEDPEAYIHGRWSAPARVVALAVTEIAGANDAAPDICAMLDRLAAAFQIKDDVENMPRDLERGRITYPVAVVADAARIPLHPPPEKNQILGAMVATRSLPLIVATAEALVVEARRNAGDLGLSTLASYLDDAGAGFADRTKRVSGTAGPPPRAGTGRAPVMRLSKATVPSALDMAERFLLSERTFRESWETHREGMFGAPEVASRYPAGLILEILQGRGLAVTREIDDFLAFTVANEFRYYDHRWSHPDSDTVGVFLRLRRHSSSPNDHDAQVSRIVGCLERQIEPGGPVPVWIRDCDEPSSNDPRPPILDLGEGCATVTAHLFIGLLVAGDESYRPIVESGATHLLGRLHQIGVGANVNYPPLYALAVFFRLLALLDDAAPGASLIAGIATARARLLTELHTRLEAAPATPQAAALAAIASRNAGQPDALDRRWMRTVLKHQRSDGSWIGEPFAAAPNRGARVSWYSSTTLTSALCYDALAGAAALDSRSLITA